MARRGVLADSHFYARGQTFVERKPLLQLDEEHDANVALPILTDDERLDDLVQAFHLPIDLGGADAHAAGVEHGIRAAVDDEAAVLGLLAPVAVTPHVREFFEVGGAVLGAVRVVPETDRHAGKGLGADELALLALERLAVLVEDLDRHAEALRLDFAAPYRAHRVAEHEAGHDVGAPGDRRQADVVLDVTVDVVEALGKKRRARGKDRAEPVQAMRFLWLHARLGERVDELRRGAEMRDPFGFGEVEENLAAADEWRAVVEDEGRTRR